MNRILLRQLAKLQIHNETPPTIEQWNQFLTAISESYDQQYRKSIQQDHMIDVVLKEYQIIFGQMQQLNENLEQVAREKTQQLMDRQNSIQNQKLQALGEISAGIAHEINNPLTTIYGKVSQLRRKFSSNNSVSPEEVTLLCESIESNIRRMVDIINALKRFARDESGLPFEERRIQDIINETLALFHDKLQNGAIEFVPSIEQEAIFVQIRPSQIEQVLMNLINNAIDATTRQPQPRIFLSLSRTSENAEIRVWDNGPGVPEALEYKIMQPFFTTKAAGKGTGMGLSISLGIARDHQGSIELDRSTSSSCFLFRIPLLKEAPISKSNLA